MWRTAGLGGEPKDGFSYYSRRATFAGVLGATFLYWLDDQSEGARDSWAFLDRRIDERDADRPNALDVEGWAHGCGGGRRPRAALT